MRTASITELQSLLEELTAKHKVPGATVAVLDGGQITEAATGLINKNTGVEVTTDTLFQIGSITKPYTATLVMQLVDEGRIELDKPVSAYVPGLKFADPAASESITMRQLLSHTSGLDGEYEDTGRGDDCIKEFVARCANLPQLKISGPGRVFSYCNACFVLAGHLIEQLTGQTWDAVLKERLLDPMGTQRTVTLPEEAILHRAAVGHHDPANSGELKPVPVWARPRSGGPAGRIISTAAEVLSFACLHLNDGMAGDGTTVLSREGVRAMQQQQVEIPDRWFAHAWGLGWALFNWDGHRVIGHDGLTTGQYAFLRIVPNTRFAICLLANGYTAVNLCKDLFKRLFAEHMRIEVPDTPMQSDGVQLDPSLYAGSYERMNVRTRVEVQDGGLVATVEYGDLLKEEAPTIEREPLRPINKASFLWQMPVVGDVPVVFFDFDDYGRPRYLHTWGHANQRIG